jgi:ABC-type transport system involved in cytochrome bd biosynthesis fused ATPase/permease subunit
MMVSCLSVNWFRMAVASTATNPNSTMLAGVDCRMNCLAFRWWSTWRTEEQQRESREKAERKQRESREKKQTQRESRESERKQREKAERKQEERESRQKSRKIRTLAGVKSFAYTVMLTNIVKAPLLKVDTSSLTVGVNDCTNLQGRAREEGY